jgi:hypothetical protein
MDLHPHPCLAPWQSPFIGFVHLPKRSTRQEMLPNRGDASFHLVLVLGFPHFGRIGHKPMMPFPLGIGSVQGGILKIGLHHSRLQVIQYHRLQNASEEPKGPPVSSL